MASPKGLAQHYMRLLGSGSGIGGGLDGGASSSGCVGCSRSSAGCSSSGVSCSGSCVGCSSCRFRCGCSRCSSRLNSHGSGCRSRLFLLAASGQSSGSNQGGDDEGFVHFSFSLRTIKKTKNATTSSLLQPGSLWQRLLRWSTFTTQSKIILGIRQYWIIPSSARNAPVLRTTDKNLTFTGGILTSPLKPQRC